MRILLVKAKETTDSIQPLLGLGFLAAVVSPPHDVRITDCIRLGLEPSGLVASVREFEADLVGIQVGTFGLEAAVDSLQAIRKAFPGIWTVAGGSHPTVRPTETLEHFGEGLDFAFQGEAETGFPRLIEVLEDSRGDRGSLSTAVLSSIPGLVWRDPEGGTTANPPVTTDLASVPMPRWDLLDPRNYPPSPHGAFFRKSPVAPVSVSRGCPCQCAFCAGSRIHGHTVRYRPVERVLEEIRSLHGKYQVREIQFVDDNLTWDRSYTHALCDGIGSLGFPVIWSCPNGIRLDRLDRSLVQHMRQSGFYAAGIGIESGSQRMLEKLRKGLTIERVRRQIDLLVDEGIETRGFFVLGFPGETRDEILDTIRFSLELPLDFAHFMLFHPMPGTACWDEVVAEGRLDTIDWTASTFAEVAYAPKDLEPDELKSLHRKALLKFYLRPSRLVRLLGQVRSVEHAWYLTRRMARWLQ